jgi:hypothetical protein
MKQGFSDWRIIQPVSEVEFNADAAFISDYDAYKLTGLARDFEQHSIFLFSLLRRKAGRGWVASFALLCTFSAGLRSPTNGASKNGIPCVIRGLARR